MLYLVDKEDDPHWRDLAPFYEYFQGDTGACIGASQQIGWTGWVARIIQANAVVTKELLLAPGAEATNLHVLQAGPAAQEPKKPAKPARKSEPGR